MAKNLIHLQRDLLKSYLETRISKAAYTLFSCHFNKSTPVPNSVLGTQFSNLWE